MSGAVRVNGLRDLNRALARTSKDVRLGVRKELREVAEPIRSEAEDLAKRRIRNIGPNWSRMRVGVTQDLVYIAPRQRGVKSGPRRRPNLAVRLMEDAMRPALNRHAHEVEKDLDEMLGRVSNKFSR